MPKGSKPPGPRGVPAEPSCGRPYARARPPATSLQELLEALGVDRELALDHAADDGAWHLDAARARRLDGPGEEGGLVLEWLELEGALEGDGPVVVLDRAARMRLVLGAGPRGLHPASHEAPDLGHLAAHAQLALRPPDLEQRLLPAREVVGVRDELEDLL